MTDQLPWLLTDTSDGEETRFASKYEAVEAQSVPWETVEYRPQHIVVPEGWEWSMTPESVFRFRTPLTIGDQFWELSLKGDEFVLTAPADRSIEPDIARVRIEGSVIEVAWLGHRPRERWLNLAPGLRSAIRAVVATGFAELSSSAGLQDEHTYVELPGTEDATFGPLECSNCWLPAEGELSWPCRPTEQGRQFRAARTRLAGLLYEFVYEGQDFASADADMRGNYLNDALEVLAANHHLLHDDATPEDWR